MTHSIKLADATFTKVIGTPIAHLDLADMFLLLGGTQAESTKNYAGAKDTAVVVGSPVYAANYATVSNLNGFEESAAASSTSFTYIGVVTQNTGSTYMPYLGRVGGTNGSELTRNTTNLNLVMNSPTASTPMGASGFQFIAGSYNNPNAAIYLGGAGALTKATASAARTIDANKFRIGGFGGIYTGTFNAAAVGFFKSALTETQVLELYLSLQKALLLRGVTVA